MIMLENVFMRLITCRAASAGADDCSMMTLAGTLYQNKDIVMGPK
jgi:hypothetical protein